MLNTSAPEMKFAIEAVRKSIQITKQVQAEMAGEALTKKDRSPVTVADFAVQALVANLLQKSFPEDVLVGEEKADTLRTPEGKGTLEKVVRFVKDFLPDAEPNQICDWIDRGTAVPTQRFWTLDPVDGTKGFLRGEQYVVAFALIVDGKVELGVLGCPELVDSVRPQIGGPGSIVVAARGQGAWCTSAAKEDGEFIQLHVSHRQKPNEARVLSSVESTHTNLNQVDDFKQIFETNEDLIMMDSQAKHAVLAAGGGDVFFRPIPLNNPGFRTKIWDEAAGSIIIEEAGGKASDLDGKPFDFGAGRTLANNIGILLSNGYLHTPAVETLKKVLNQEK